MVTPAISPLAVFEPWAPFSKNAMESPTRYAGLLYQPCRMKPQEGAAARRRQAGDFINDYPYVQAVGSLGPIVI
jgi:hypothetical protein